jgi:predicted Rossmann fold flavoprotein
MKIYDVAIIGAGAAGLMAAAGMNASNLSVLILEQNSQPAIKVKISGGGRCNFTNLNITADNYISNNKHFVKSSLAGFTANDFINLVKKHNIAYHEKTLGQLFCDKSSSQIIQMLLDESCNAELLLNCVVNDVSKSENFTIETSLGCFTAKKLIIASGGLSIPKLGVSDLAYKIAKKFDINIINTSPGLVPLLYNKTKGLEELAGISIDANVAYKKQNFRENILFTHKGLSGPAILQISSYLENFNQKKIMMNLLPNIEINIDDFLDNNISVMLKKYLPNRFIDNWFKVNFQDQKIINCKRKNLEQILQQLNNFEVEITNSEGFDKAEVTKGGIDTNELSSQNMEAKKVKNLFFIGESVDVTGWLGGYNFQWAWSSGMAVASYINKKA